MESKTLNFPYDFDDASRSPTRMMFDTNDSEASPYLGLDILPPSPTSFQTSLRPSYLATSPIAHSFTSASTSGSRSLTPLDLSMSGSEVDEKKSAHVHNRHLLTSTPSSASESQGYDSGPSARYHPTAGAVPQSSTRRCARRGNIRGEETVSDEESDPVAEKPTDPGVCHSDIIQRRREQIRRQRFESEQRRRDELRDGYCKLKNALPISNQKSSKVSLLDRAVTYVRQLEASQASLMARLDKIENELTRLRDINEELMRNMAEQHRTVIAAAAASVHAPFAQPS